MPKLHHTLTLGLFAAIVLAAPAALAGAYGAPPMSRPAMSIPPQNVPPMSRPGGLGGLGLSEAQLMPDVTFATALPAGQGAMIARVRASAGPADTTMNYEVNCGTEVNFGSITGDGQQVARIDGVYAQRIVVVNNGRCRPAPDPMSARK